MEAVQMCVKSKGRWTWYSCRGTAAVTVAAKGGVLTLKFKVAAGHTQLCMNYIKFTQTNTIQV